MATAKVFTVLVTRDANPQITVMTALDLAIQHGGGQWRGVSTSPHSVAEARNTAVKNFLEREDATHVMMVDDDVITPENTIPLLLGCYANVAAGCVPVKVYNKTQAHLNIASHWKDGKAQWFPTWFDGKKEVVLAGTGCMMIKREVFSRFEFPYFIWPPDWHQNPHLGSDDMKFCQDVNDKGLGPIVAHGGVRCGHYKKINLAEMMTT